MSNDNISKEEEKASGEVLNEPGNTEKKDSKEKRERPIIINFSFRSPINYDSLIVEKEIEIEARESYKLKQSLGIF